MQSSNFYVTQNYFIHYDLINKFNLTNISSNIEINSINVTLPLKNVIKSLENGNISEKSIEVQITGFFLFFIFFFKYSFLNNKYLIKQNKSKELEITTSLIISLNNLKTIRDFIYTLFVENFGNLMLEEVKPLSHFHTIKSTCQKSTDINIAFAIPAYLIFEMAQICNMSYLNLNSKECIFSVNIHVKNSLSQSFSLNLLKQLPFFWIND